MREKLNILIFNYSARPIGGSQYSSLAIAQELKQIGHNVFFASEYGPLVEILESNGIRHYTIHIRKFIPYMNQFSAISLLKLVRIISENNIDCIHCFQYYPFLLSCFAQMITGVPCIYSVIGPIIYRVPRFHGKIIAYCGEFRDKLISRSIYLNKNDIEIIANRIDLNRYRHGLDGSYLLSKFNIKNDGHKVVMVTRFDNTKIKAIMDLIACVPYVIEKLPETRFIIVGDGREFDRIKQIIEGLNQKLGQKVIFLTGRLNEIPEMLNVADIVIGVGRSVLEGMSCQKPAIVVGEYGFAGIVQRRTVENIAYHNFAGRNISKNSDPKNLSNAIMKILTDQNYANNLAKFSRDYIEENFDIVKGIHCMENLYRQLCFSNSKISGYNFNQFSSTVICLCSAVLDEMSKAWQKIKNGQIKELLVKNLFKV